MKRKARGFWEDFENVKNALIPLIGKYGRFPSSNEMIRDGFSSLARSIAKYHGGILTVSKKLGIKTFDESIDRNSHHTWTKEKVLSDYKNYIKSKNINYYPSRYEMKEDGVNIYIGITQVFSNYKNFKAILKSDGYVLDIKQKNIKWTWSSALQTLLPIVKDLGYMPSNSDLDKLGLCGLRGFINKSNVKQKLKEHLDINGKLRKYTVSRESGHWDNLKNIEQAILYLYEKYGRIPKGKELAELGYGSLSQHIKRLDASFLEKYNYFATSNLIKTKDGHYVRSNYELLLDNYFFINNISHQTEQVILKDGKRKFKFDFKINLLGKDIYFEIWGYTKERNKFEERYQIKRCEKEKLYHQSNLNLIGINSDIFEMSFNLIYDHFTNQIKKYDSSFVPREMDLDLFLWGSHYSINDVLTQLQIIVRENNGYFPSTSYLRQIKGGDGLISQIQKFGGVEIFKNKLNINIKPHESKWTLDKLKYELYSLNKHKYIPSDSELKSFNRLDILGGIHKNGGFKKVSAILQIPSSTIFRKTQPKISKSKWSIDFLINELKPIINELGRLPNERELRKMKRVDIVYGIKMNGGFKKLKNIISGH